MLNKRDINVPRTPSDVERRFKLNDIENKVEKEEGKGLSTNDFTNEYKNKVDNNAQARHTHSNKSVLDTITSAKLQSYDALVSTNYIFSLFSGDEDGDVTLLDNPSNYDMIEIVYGDDNVYDTKVLGDINAKSFILSLDIDTTTTIKAQYTISNLNITKDTAETDIRVFEVIAYNFKRGVD